MSVQTGSEYPGFGLMHGSDVGPTHPEGQGRGHQSQFPSPNRKISSGSMGPLRKLSDIIGPERKLSSTLNPFYRPLEDENELTREVSNEDEEKDEGLYFDDDEEYGAQRDDDDGDGDSLDGDVRTDDDLEARRYCCGEARLNCGRFANEMKKQGSDLKKSCQKIDLKQKCKSMCNMDLLRRRFPIINWAPKYRLAEFQGDLVAGITVGLTVIPQSIAYASLAGLPNENGLYTAFIGSFVYVIFGSSKDITLGPSAVSSLLAAFFATSPISRDPTPAIMLAFFVGFIELAMFMINFGYFVNFVSFPVVKAFTVASAITIAASQVKKWFGQRGVPRDFLPQFYWTIRKIPEVRLYDFLLGVVGIFVIVSLKKIKEIPWKTKYEDLTVGKKVLFKFIWLVGLGRNIIVIILSSVVAYIFYAHGYVPFSLTGYITPGIPPFKAPAFSVYDAANNKTYSLEYISTNVIGAGYLIVPIVGLLEALAIGSVFARKFNYIIDWNQEFLAYGIGNVLTSLLGGYPITGTFSRTAVNAQCGVKTPAGGIWTGIVVLIALQFCTPAMYFIPDAALAVVIFMAVIDMVTFHKVWIFWNVNKIDLIPWILTLVLSFVISIAYGVIIGAGVSLLLLLYPTTRPKIKTLLQKSTESDGKNNGEIKLITINTGLLYPAIGNLNDILRSMYSKPFDLPRGVILDFQHVAYIDTTTVQGLRTMLENFHAKGIPLVICHLQKSVKSMLERAKPRFLLIAESIPEAEDIIIKGPKDKEGDKNKKRKRKKAETEEPPKEGIDNPSFVVTMEEDNNNNNNFNTPDNNNPNNANAGANGINERKL